MEEQGNEITRATREFPRGPRRSPESTGARVEGETQDTAAVFAEIVDVVLGYEQAQQNTLERLADRFGKEYLGPLEDALKEEKDTVLRAAEDVLALSKNTSAEAHLATALPPNLPLFVEGEHRWFGGQQQAIPAEFVVGDYQAHFNRIDGLLQAMSEQASIIADDDSNIHQRHEAEITYRMHEKAYFEAKRDVLALRCLVDETHFLQNNSPEEVIQFLYEGMEHPAYKKLAVNHLRGSDAATGRNLEGAVVDAMDDLFVPELQGQNFYARLLDEQTITRTAGTSKILAHKLMSGFWRGVEKDITFLEEFDSEGQWKDLKLAFHEAVENRRHRRDVLREHQENVYTRMPKELLQHKEIQARKRREEILQNGTILSLEPLQIVQSDGRIESLRGSFRPWFATIEHEGEQIRAVVKFAFADRAVRMGVTPGTGPERSVIETSHRLSAASLLPTEQAVQLANTLPALVAREISFHGERVWVEISEFISHKPRMIGEKDMQTLDETQKDLLFSIALLDIRRGRTDGSDRNMIIDGDGKIHTIDFSSEGGGVQTGDWPITSIAWKTVEGQTIPPSAHELIDVLNGPDGQQLDIDTLVATREILPIPEEWKAHQSLQQLRRAGDFGKLTKEETMPTYGGIYDFADRNFISTKAH